jgi:4-amino-4-deoxy-L-arabinose transferase-like glycosyltransferase
MRPSISRLSSSPWLIAGIALALHMALLYYDSRSSPASGIERSPYGFELGNVAASIAAGQGFSSPLSTLKSGPTAWFTPIYPYLVAAIFKVWGIYSKTSYVIIQVLNCIFASLIIFPIYAIARRSFGGTIAAIAAWTWAFLPTALLFPILWMWDTSLAALLFTVIFWATLVLPESRGVLPWAGYAALWAAGVLINPSIFSLFPFLLGWLVWRGRKESPQWIREVSAVLVVFVIAVAPWTIRNDRVLGAPIIFRSNFGLELWLGNNEHVVGTWTPELHPNEDVAEARKYLTMGEIAYMTEKKREAFEFMRKHPSDALYFTYHRFVYMWLGVDDPMVSLSDGYSIGKLVLNFPLSLLTLLGVYFACRAHHPAAAPFGFVVLIFPLVHYVTHPMLRYRFPIDPIMIVLAVYGLGHTISQIRNRRLHEDEKAAANSPSLSSK